MLRRDGGASRQVGMIQTPASAVGIPSSTRLAKLDEGGEKLVSTWHPAILASDLHRDLAPRRFEAPSGPPVQAVVKWYNPEKGFGFAELADGSGDAFLHVSVVERSGHGSVPPGAMLEVRAGPGPNLAQCRHRHAEADGALGGV